MNISNWAKEYCTHSQDLVLLFGPTQQYICTRNTLTNLLSHSSQDLPGFLNDLTSKQYPQPNFSLFYLQTVPVFCSDNLLKNRKDNNDNLECLLEQYPAQLKDKRALLEQTQNKLIESEHFTSLSGLVAGITLEGNASISISITTTSHLVVQTTDINDHYLNKKMKKLNIDEYFHCALDSALNTSPKELTYNIKKSFLHQLKNRFASFISHINNTLCIYNSSGKLKQLNCQLSVTCFSN